MDEVELNAEREQWLRDKFQEGLDALKGWAAGKWVEVHDDELTFAINSRNVFSVVPEKISGKSYLVAYFSAYSEDPTHHPILSGRAFSRIGDKPATIENWLQAVES